MAIGDVNPILKANTLYYDLDTGVAKFGHGDGTRWEAAPYACVEPAPTTSDVYGRQGDTWVRITGIIISEAEPVPVIETGQSLTLVAGEEMEPYQISGANLK